MTNARGADFSAYQQTLTVPHLDGLSFAFCKATEGPSSVDRNFAHNWAVMALAGVHRGAYHELWPAGSAPAAAQAAHFAVTVRASVLKPGDMLACVASDYSGVTDAEVKEFCDEVTHAVGSAHPVLPYTSLNVGKTLTGTARAYPHVWIAWPNGTPPWPELWQPAGWDTWRIWQNGYVTIGGERVDSNLFNGTPGELDAWIATYTTKRAPDPGGTAMTPAVTAAADGLHYFAVGTDSAVWTKQPGDTNWTSLGGDVTGGLGATTDAAGTITVAMRGTNGQCWSKQRDTLGTWSGWVSQGGNLQV